MTMLNQKQNQFSDNCFECLLLFAVVQQMIRICSLPTVIGWLSSAWWNNWLVLLGVNYSCLSAYRCTTYQLWTFKKNNATEFCQVANGSLLLMLFCLYMCVCGWISGNSKMAARNKRFRLITVDVLCLQCRISVHHFIYAQNFDRISLFRLLMPSSNVEHVNVVERCVCVCCFLLARFSTAVYRCLCGCTYVFANSLCFCEWICCCCCCPVWFDFVLW